MSIRDDFEKDVFSTSMGELTLYFLGHGSLRLAFGGKEIYADPFSEAADYSKLPKADMILVTHHHSDHFDIPAIQAIRTDKTEMVYTAACAEKLPGGTVLRNGDSHTACGIPIEAVPAYNLVHKRPNGRLFHVPGESNGYILSFGDRRIYIAGDTENIPEMKGFGRINIAFLPVNLPYTMSVEMAADAARMIRPHVFYPYHYGETDLARLTALLADEQKIEIRIRRMA